MLNSYELPFGEKLLVKGGGEQNRLFRLSRKSSPSSMEEFGEQDSCMMTDPLMGSSHHFLFLANPSCIFGFMIDGGGIIDGLD